MEKLSGSFMVLFFFFAHTGYLWYALFKGNMRWKFTIILLTGFDVIITVLFVVLKPK